MSLPDARLQRIAFVTSRYAELQGLKFVILGAGILLSVLTWGLLPDGSRHFFQQMNMQLFFWVIVGGIWADRYYSRWFGNVPLVPAPRFAFFHAVSADASQSAVPVGRPENVGAWVIYMALMIEAVKGIVYPGGVSLVAAAVTGYSAWVLVQDGARRLQYVLGLAAGAAGLALTWAVPASLRFPGPPETALVLPYAQTYGILGVALIAVGLLDHRLLVTSMASAASSAAGRSSAPDPVLSRFRAIAAAASLVVMVVHLALAGWPRHPLYIYWSLTMVWMLLLVGAQQLDLWKLTAERRRMDDERKRAREERLVAKVKALRGETVKVEIEGPPPRRRLPPFDLVGHLILPLAIACGALADISLRGSGVPSLLALGLAASHLRIALRDWTTRKYYLLGTVAASLSALHSIVSPGDGVAWIVGFIIFVSAAMLVEGLLDLRLARWEDAQFSKEHHHADAI